MSAFAMWWINPSFTIQWIHDWNHNFPKQKQCGLFGNLENNKTYSINQNNHDYKWSRFFPKNKLPSACERLLTKITNLNNNSFKQKLLITNFYIEKYMSSKIIIINVNFEFHMPYAQNLSQSLTKIIITLQLLPKALNISKKRWNHFNKWLKTVSMLYTLFY